MRPDSIGEEDSITVHFTTATGQEAALSVAAATQGGQQGFVIEGTFMKGICVENSVFSDVFFLQCLCTSRNVFPILYLLT